MTVSPLNWLEASYFYYRPSDLWWGPSSAGEGLYLDKGFNVKFIHRPKDYSFINLAIGLDDFAGTGLFSKEYVVSTIDLEKLKFSLGIGWGRFAGNDQKSNPLSFISNKFDFRQRYSDNYNLGGSLSYDQWFRGPASYFGGIELPIKFLRGLSIKIEYDPFLYYGNNALGSSDYFTNRGERISIRNKESNFNFGFSYPINDFLTIDGSYIKGNTLNINFNIAFSFNRSLLKKKEFKPLITQQDLKNNKKDTFYLNLLNNLNQNKLFLQTARLNNKDLTISISTSEHRNSIRSASYAALISKKVAKNNELNLSSISITHINAGIELNKIKFISPHLDNKNIPIEIIKKYTSFSPGDMSYKKDDFKPRVKFPVFFQSVSPSLINHIGSPARVYYGGVTLQHIGEIQFQRNLMLSSEINYVFYDNFKDINANPDSRMQRVRTDVVKYLRESDFQISSLTLDYLFSPKKNIFGKVSAGYFEKMYAGIGGEILYKPFDKNYSIGLEMFYVEQRSFAQDFRLKNYSTTTGHINFGYLFPYGFETNLSIGRYLAKDDGYTLDISRKTQSGFKAGIYFSRTNVSAELFGEGSFDKGFYWQIPVDLFSKGYSANYTNFKLSPLTRDGGAKLNFRNIKSMISNTSRNELYNDWSGYLN